MDIPNGKIHVFLDAVQALANEACDKIDRETESVRAQRLQALESEAKKRSEAFAAYEISRIDADFNREISDLEEASRKRLTERRDALEAQVFDRVRARLARFTASDAYRTFLEASAKKAVAAVGGGDVTVYLREADLPLADAVLAACSGKARIEADSSIALGGLKVRSGAGLLADDTLDARVETQKARFLSVSGLSLEEEQA